jgi:hypothetical protein
MKAYVREHKVNHPEVRLTMKRGEMIAGLKKAGHLPQSLVFLLVLQMPL